MGFLRMIRDIPWWADFIAAVVCGGAAWLVLGIEGKQSSEWLVNGGQREDKPVLKWLEIAYKGLFVLAAVWIALGILACFGGNFPGVIIPYYD
jgi:hypothetical protein